jgi:hypothetical protein
MKGFDFSTKYCTLVVKIKNSYCDGIIGSSISKLYSIALPKKKFTMAKISAFLMEGAEF